METIIFIQKRVANEKCAKVAIGLTEEGYRCAYGALLLLQDHTSVNQNKRDNGL